MRLADAVGYGADSIKFCCDKQTKTAFSFILVRVRPINNKTTIMKITILYLTFQIKPIIVLKLKGSIL